MPALKKYKIKLRNDLERENVKVKEVNAGISTLVAELAPGKTYNVGHDPNATFREYILITVPNKKELRTLTSDLFQEWKEISVFKEGPVYDWKGTVRRIHRHLPVPAALATDQVLQGQGASIGGGGRFATVWHRWFPKSS